MLEKLYKIFILPYSIFLLYLMFFGFGRTQMDTNVVRISPIYSTILFVEKSLLWSNPKTVIINVLGNIVMFIPFGFLGWVYPRFQKFGTLLITFLSILIIVEALQYFTRLGVFDVDDIILNTFGLWIGFFLCQKISQKTRKK